MLVLGDAHADDPDRRRALLAAYRESDADVALQTGDLLHYDLPTPTYFVAGNNEDFDVIDALRRGEDSAPAEDSVHGEGLAPADSSAGATVRNATLLASSVAEVEGLRVAGLSGNYAPTKYDEARADLTGERRRHFVREDVARLKRVEDVDVLLTHEAPHGLVYYGYDAGCERIDELLDALEPDLCLVGHHERHVEATYGDTRAVSLAPAWERYYELDPETLELSDRATPTE
ncbi:metallophosphoesterase [Halorussus gelatinilyticus]|uniref:Metallophosphoesterase n=1 Tax=Halorussus gelatinilyticus TaxID=2937524 RepID=A0A8U0IQL4_9EURY|nr:metallophosphoesterase [Halorussus gelatinilyticus]UPW02319.1 metallophosphoesterase [Halorussus gelatinilyticus]